MSAEELRAKIREVPDFPKPGILFYDITTLLKDPAAYRESIDLMLEPYRDEKIDIVVGMESRGFIFSAPMAYQLDAGLVPVRKLGKLPGGDDHRRVRARVRLEHARDPPRRDPARPAGPDRRRPARDRRHRPRHDRARRAAEGRGRRSGVPGRARVPQGPRPARGTPRHERHPVLSRFPHRGRTDWPTLRATPAPARRRSSAASRSRSRSGADPAARHDRGAGLQHAGGATSVGGGSSGHSPASCPDRGHGGRRGPGAAAGVGRGGQRDPEPGELGRDARPERRRRWSDGPDRLPDAVPGGRRRAPPRSTSASCPDALVEYPCRSAGDVAYAIREMVVRGAPAIGQVAAIGLALTRGEPARRAPVRPQGDDPRLGQRADQRAPDGGQPALGGRPGDGALRRDRRPVGGRRRDRRRDARRGRRDRLRGDDRPRPAGRVRPRDPARTGGSAGPHPDPLQHRAAGLRPVRDGARRRPGGAPCRARGPRLGRRDPAVPPGRPADDLGARPGRRPAHARSPTWPPGT